MFSQIKKLEAAHRRHPETPLFARLADAYLARGRTEEALELCEEGCERFPDYPTGFQVLGKCYQATGQFEEARSALDRALRLDPVNPGGFRQLCEIYSELGVATLALKSAQQALHYDPLNHELTALADRLQYDARLQATTPQGARAVVDESRTPPPEPVEARPIVQLPAAPAVEDATEARAELAALGAEILGEATPSVEEDGDALAGQDTDDQGTAPIVLPTAVQDVEGAEEIGGDATEGLEIVLPTDVDGAEATGVLPSDPVFDEDDEESISVEAESPLVESDPMEIVLPTDASGLVVEEADVLPSEPVFDEEDSVAAADEPPAAAFDPIEIVLPTDTPADPVVEMDAASDEAEAVESPVPPVFADEIVLPEDVFAEADAAQLPTSAEESVETEPAGSVADVFLPLEELSEAEATEPSALATDAVVPLGEDESEAAVDEEAEAARAGEDVFDRGASPADAGSLALDIVVSENAQPGVGSAADGARDWPPAAPMILRAVREPDKEDRKVPEESDEADSGSETTRLEAEAGDRAPSGPPSDRNSDEVQSSGPGLSWVDIPDPDEAAPVEMYPTVVPEAEAADEVVSVVESSTPGSVLATEAERSEEEADPHESVSADQETPPALAAASVDDVDASGEEALFAAAEEPAEQSDAAETVSLLATDLAAAAASLASDVVEDSTVVAGAVDAVSAEEDVSPVAVDEPSFVEQEPSVAVDASPVSVEEPPVVDDQSPVAVEELPVSADESLVDELLVVDDESSAAVGEPPVAVEEAPVVEDVPPVVDDEPPVAVEEPVLSEADALAVSDPEETAVEAEAAEEAERPLASLDPADETMPETEEKRYLAELQMAADIADLMGRETGSAVTTADPDPLAELDVLAAPEVPETPPNAEPVAPPEVLVSESSLDDEAVEASAEPDMAADGAPPEEEVVYNRPTGLAARGDGELIRLFQEIESERQGQASKQEPPVPPDGDGGAADSMTGEEVVLPPFDALSGSRIATVTLAEIYSSQGLVQRAIDTYRRILEQDPGNQEIKAQLAALENRA